jgi:hypothetical protein
LANELVKSVDGHIKGLRHCVQFDASTEAEDPIRQLYLTFLRLLCAYEELVSSGSQPTLPIAAA